MIGRLGMDHRKLLQKYMRHIEFHEGGYYLSDGYLSSSADSGDPDISFSQEEILELRAIKNEKPEGSF